MTLDELVQSQASRTPAAIAVRHGGEELSYSDLAARARRLGACLQRLGVTADVPVAISGARGSPVAWGLLGILMAGGACLPLDPAHPEARLRAMLADARPSALVTAAGAPNLPFSGPVVSLDDTDRWAGGGEPVGIEPRSGVDTLAYILYTSGSTGVPKGVMLPHRSLVHHARAVTSLYGLRPGDRVVQFTSIGFDVSIEEMYPTWAAGATVVPRPDDVEIMGHNWLRWLVNERITVLNLPTAYWHEWVQDLLRLGERVPASLRLVVAGGERALGSAYRTWQSLGGDQVRWINAYGPAECGPMVTAFEPEPDRPWPEDRDPPIGRPVGDATVRVVDGAGRSIATGTSGELLIGGPGLARGYLGRPDLTAERFVLDPDRDGARFYRTGDRVRVRDDGNLEYAGRVDGQVKVRGFRVEPEEVESALARHPQVAGVAVASRQVHPAQQQLVAYVVPAEGSDPSASELRRFLAETLPAQMLPSAFVSLAVLPLNPNGKVDREALPAPDEASRPSPEGRSPRTPVERAIAAIWSRVLGIDGIGVDESFFDLGGHSLLAAQVVVAIREDMSVDIGLQALLDAPTIAGLATSVERSRAAPDVPPPLRAHPRAPDERFPLSLSQEHMWRLERSADPPGLYNITAQHQFAAPVDVPALEAALAHVAQRHLILNAYFQSDGERPLQSLAAPASPSLAVHDLERLPPEDQLRRSRELVVEQDSHPFDVSQAPLWRAGLMLAANGQSLLAVTLDHLICDGTSAYILLSELTDAYESIAAGRTPARRPLPVQYVDFARWQRAWFTEERLRPQLDYWRRTLAGMPLGPGLPFDHVPERPSRQIRMLRVSIDTALYREMGRVARDTDSTRFVVTAAAVQALVARTGGRDDAVLSTTLSGRQRAELDGLIGCFHGVGRIRTNLGGDPTFAEVVARVRQAVVGLFEHQDVPFMQIRQAVLTEYPAGGPSLLAAVPIELQYFHTAHDEWAPGAGVVERPGPEPGPDSLFFRGHMHPLLITFLDDGTALWGELSYKVDFYETRTIERLGRGLQRLLRAAVRDTSMRLSALDLVDRSEPTEAGGPASMSEGTLTGNWWC